MNLLDTKGRPWTGCDSQGNPPHHAYSRGRPVTDDIEAVGTVLLRDDRLVETSGVALYIAAKGLGDAADVWGAEAV